MRIVRLAGEQNKVVVRRNVMKKMKFCILAAAVAAAFCLSSGNVSAQSRGNFDPEQFRQRIMDNLREKMEVKSDDEWKIISDRITKVMDARRDIGFGGGMSMFRSGSSRRSGSSDSSTNAPSSDSSSRRSRFGGEPSAEEAALQKAIDDKAPADQVKAKLAALRDSRKAKEAKLEKAQEDLKKVLSVKQEAVAVLNGLLK